MNKISHSINPYILVSALHSNPFCFNFLTGELFYISRNVYEFLKRGEKNNRFQSYKDIKNKRLIFKSKKSRENYIQKVVDKKNKKYFHSKLELSILPTFACNLSCKYCINKQVISNRTDTMIDSQKIKYMIQALDIISKRHKQKIHKEILLSGGEPLTLNTQVLEKLLKQCKKRRFQIKLNTNGILISHHYNLFKKYSRQFSQVQITIDGPKETHNKLRYWIANKNKSFSTTMKGIKLLRKHKIPLLLRTNIMKENINQLEKLYDIYKKEHLIDNDCIQFRFVRAFSFHTCTLYYRRDLEVVKMLTKLRKEKVRKFILYRYAYPRIFLVMLKMMSGKIKKESLVGGYPCTAMVGRMLSFGPDGNIYTCINSVGIKSFMVGSYWPKFYLDKRLLKKFEEVNVEYYKKCKTCNQKYICRGGCPLKTFVLHKNLKSPICSNAKEDIENLFNLVKNYLF